MILIVMYELNTIDELVALEETLDAAGPHCHFLNSFSLVSTHETPSRLGDQLRHRRGPRSSIYISQLTQRHAEFLPDDARHWIASQRERYTDAAAD